METVTGVRVKGEGEVLNQAHSMFKSLLQDQRDTCRHLLLAPLFFQSLGILREKK